MPISDPRAIAVIYDRADALAVRQGAYECRSVLALSPNARVEWGGAATTLAERLGDDGHGRIVAEANILHRALWAQTAGMAGLGPAARSTFVHGLHPLVTLALAVRDVLGDDGPWLLPGPGGFQLETDPVAAARRLIAHIQAGDRFSAGLLRFDGWSAATNLVTRVTAALAGARSLVVQSARYGLANMAARAGAKGIRTLGLRGASGGWRDFASAVRALGHALRGDDVVQLVVAPDSPDQGLLDRLKAVLDGTADPYLLRVIGPQMTVMARQAVLTQSLVPVMAGLLDKSRNRTVALHSARWMDEAGLAEAGGRAGLRRVLMSHGSHCGPQQGAAMIEHCVNADGLLTSPLADVAVVQSPLAEAFATHARPEQVLMRSRPLMWGYKQMPEPATGARPLRILHAGTFKPLTALRPFIYESADEYVAGLVDLCHAVAKIGGARLAIRLRGGRECDAEALARLLPANGCWELSPVPAFLEDLAASDLLVTFASTTAEEALQARRPVLLWGGTGRCRHLPASTIAPTADKRAPVYAVEQGGDLASMLGAILAAHRITPLTDEELTGYTWPEGTPGLEQFLAEIA